MFTKMRYDCFGMRYCEVPPDRLRRSGGTVAIYLNIRSNRGIGDKTKKTCGVINPQAFFVSN